MFWFSVALVALLLGALMSPLFISRLSRRRQARHVHRRGVLHWYPNYDENLRFEPKNDRDIIAVSRADLVRLGYEPSGEPVRVPRTFRRQIAGDRRLRLWTSEDATLRPVWICCWVHRVDLSGGRGDINPTLQLHQTMLVRSGDGRSEVTDSSMDVSVPVVVWDSDEGSLEQEETRPSGDEATDSDPDAPGESGVVPESSRSDQAG